MATIESLVDERIQRHVKRLTLRARITGATMWMIAFTATAMLFVLFIPQVRTELGALLSLSGVVLSIGGIMIAEHNMNQALDKYGGD